jgi:hypothetical protein
VKIIFKISVHIKVPLDSYLKALPYAMNFVVMTNIIIYDILVVKVWCWQVKPHFTFRKGWSNIFALILTSFFAVDSCHSSFTLSSRGEDS